MDQWTDQAVRIKQYGFVENQDFVCSPILGSKGRGGHNAKEYHLTLDMTKELSMGMSSLKIKDYTTTHQNRGVANGDFKEVTEYHLTIDILGVTNVTFAEKSAKVQFLHKFVRIPMATDRPSISNPCTWPKARKLTWPSSDYQADYELLKYKIFSFSPILGKNPEGSSWPVHSPGSYRWDDARGIRKPFIR